MSFRLVIDFEMGDEEGAAVQASEELLAEIRKLDGEYREWGQYRLVRDEDRSARNYLSLDENGKARTSKLKL